MGVTEDVEVVRDLKMELGEGPVWVEREKALWFVDIKKRHLHRYDPETKALESVSAPDQPGFVLPAKTSGFIVGLKTGLHRYDPATRAFELLTKVEPERPGNRLNDGAVGPDGALYFGSMDDTEQADTGSLFRLGKDGKPVVLDTDYGITNGPCFSPDGRTFYHTDTRKRVTYAFDRAADGALTRKRVFITFDGHDGSPDGSVVDAEGCIWVSMFHGWGVRRFSPKGELLTMVKFPCSNITKIAFGGPDGRTCYATTALLHLTPEVRAQQPLAGALFRFRAPVPGLKNSEVTVGV